MIYRHTINKKINAVMKPWAAAIVRGLHETLQHTMAAAAVAAPIATVIDHPDLTNASRFDWPATLHYAGRASVNTMNDAAAWEASLKSFVFDHTAGNPNAWPVKVVNVLETGFLKWPVGAVGYPTAAATGFFLDFVVRSYNNLETPPSGQSASAPSPSTRRSPHSSASGPRLG